MEMMKPSRHQQRRSYRHDPICHDPICGTPAGMLVKKEKHLGLGDA